MNLIEQQEINKIREDFLVKPMMPICGAYSFFAAAGVGKTTLVSQLIKCILKKQPFLGMETNPDFNSQVCYISLEMTEQSYQVDFFDQNQPTFMLELNDEELQKINFIDFRNKSSLDLINKLDELKEYKLIVIDLVSYVSDYSEINKDSGKTAIFFSTLNKIAEQNKQFFVCVAHTLKDAKTFAGQETLKGAVSGQYVLYTNNKSVEENEFVLANNKSRFEKSQKELFLKRQEDRSFSIIETMEFNIPTHLNLIQGALAKLKRPKEVKLNFTEANKENWICPDFNYLFDEENEWYELDMNYLILMFNGERSKQSISNVLIDQKNQKMLLSNGLVIAVRKSSSHHCTNTYYFHFLENNCSTLNEQLQEEDEKNTTLEKSNELFDNTKVEVVKYEQQSLVVDNNYSFKEKEVQ